uniref:Ribosomal protein S2 n=1 Tax=Piridium sociabile TaxID=2570542 RepID=A0A5B9XWF2_9ALVE|nr:ribosomal protein S2 [Piridium sociabile]
MSLITLEKLIKSKLYIGKYTHKWNSKNIHYIRSYIQGYIIFDLVYTSILITNTYMYFFKASKRGHKFLFISTKPGTKDLIKKAGIISGSFYINEKWINGFISNWDIIKHQINLFRWVNNLVKISENIDIDLNLLKNKYNKSLTYFQGVHGLNKLPKIVFILDIDFDNKIFKELSKSNIILSSLINSDINIKYIHLPIPGNNSNIKSIYFILKILISAIIKGKIIKNEINGNRAHEPFNDSAVF